MLCVCMMSVWYTQMFYYYTVQTSREYSVHDVINTSYDMSQKYLVELSGVVRSSKV